MGYSPQTSQQPQQTQQYQPYGASSSGGYPYYSNVQVDPYQSSYVMNPNDPRYAGMPATPGFKDIYNADTMSLLNGYEQYMDQNSQGYDQFSDEATRDPGSQSAWATIAKQYQDASAADAREKGASEVAGQNAKAMSNLAAQGGLSSGARERTAEAGAKNFIDLSQDLTRQNNLNDMQIDMNDEQNRIKMLSELPGMEQNRANAWQSVRQGDLSNQISNNKALNDYSMGIFGKQMDAWAADKQATATENSGKK